MITKLALAIMATAALAVSGFSLAAAHSAGQPAKTTADRTERNLAAQAATATATSTERSNAAQPATATATSTERVLAGQKCGADAAEDRAKFRFENGSGPGAMGRCIAHRISEARFDCGRKSQEDPVEFRADYGVGAAAQQSCIHDDVS